MPARAPKKPATLPNFEITLPATSANLGPAFDAAALALSIFLNVQARVAGQFSITAQGRDAQICGKIEDNLILRTYREILQAEPGPVPPLALRIENAIPIGKGCGSSAAARLAGIALANHFGGLGWTDEKIVSEAARREHHPDNAAACWMGGLAIARMSENGDAQMANITPKGKWPLLLAVSDQSLPTEEARQVLPTHYSRTDAVTNIQNAMLLLAAFTQGRPELLASALGDRLHQPYRATRCPLLPALRPLTGTPGILGVALSGAGPSVLIFLDAKTDADRTKRRIRNKLNQQGLSAELLLTETTVRGARQGIRSPFG